MDCFVAGVESISVNKDGKSFSFKQLVILAPSENINSSTYTKSAYGMQVLTMPCNDLVMAKLEGVKLPGTFRVDTSARSRGRTFETLAVDITPVNGSAK